MRTIGALVLVVTAGCASAPIKKSDAASLAMAETRLLEGCYVCLLEARDVFEQVAVGKARPLVVARLFEVHVLIGLRERELALDSGEAFSKARALLSELPATYDGSAYLDLAALMPPDLAGTPRTELTSFRLAVPPRARLNEIKVRLATGEASAPFRAYLSASVECLAAFANRRDPKAPAPDVQEDAPPLVKYRVATCPDVRVSALEALLIDVPAFVEAGLFLARQPSLAVTAAYVKNRRAWLLQVAQVFPRSSSVTYAAGATNQIIGDCVAAIRSYEETLALKERHEDAAMQRVICLGHVGQFVQAIEGATRVIDRGYYNLADAFYWRAWNYHRRGQLPEARADIDKARSISINVQVFTLAGVIKYDQDELVLAERDLTEAVRMDRSQCIAQWYLGLVSFKKEVWPETAAQFGRASECYEQSANTNIEKLEQMRRSNHDEAFKARQMAGFEAVIKEDRDQQWAGVLNAANAFARMDMPETALQWLDRIPADTVLAPQVAELRKLIIGGFPGR